MTDAIDYLKGYLKGKADGVKIVVDWVENWSHSISPDMYGEAVIKLTGTVFIVETESWQDKLKEWEAL